MAEMTYETGSGSAASPEELLDHLTKEIQSAQVTVQEQLIDAIAGHKQLDAEHRRALHQVSVWQSKSEIAARAGDRAARKAAQQQLKAYTAQAQAVERVLHCQEEVAGLLRARLDELGAQIAAAARERAAWEARFGQQTAEHETVDVWAELQQRQRDLSFPELETDNLTKLFTKLADG